MLKDTPQSLVLSKNLIVQRFAVTEMWRSELQRVVCSSVQDTGNIHNLFTSNPETQQIRHAINCLKERKQKNHSESSRRVLGLCHGKKKFLIQVSHSLLDTSVPEQEDTKRETLMVWIWNIFFYRRYIREWHVRCTNRISDKGEHHPTSRLYNWTHGTALIRLSLQS